MNNVQLRSKIYEVIQTIEKLQGIHDATVESGDVPGYEKDQLRAKIAYATWIKELLWDALQESRNDEVA